MSDSETDLRAENAALRARVAHLEQQLATGSVVFAEAAIGIATVSLSGQPLAVNQALVQLLGYGTDELCGMVFTDFTHPDDIALDWALFQELLAGQRHHYQIEKRYLRKDGAIRWGRLTVSAVRDAAGAILFLIGMVENIDERKHAEAQLAALNAELEQRVAVRTADIAQAARMKSAFLANMNHELRTPLTSILGMAEALLYSNHQPPSPSQATMLRVIERSGRQLLALLNDLLDMARLEAGYLVLLTDTCAAKLLCQGCLSRVQDQAMDKRQTLELLLDPPDLLLVADMQRLRQILLILLRNAIKFTPEGGRVGLEVRGDAAARVVHLSVWDTGIGISEADLARLSEPFIQLDDRLNRLYGGIGMGLALARGLIDLHGGQLTVSSTQHQGSRFTVTLPWPDPATHPADSPSTLAPAALPQDTGGQG